MFVRLIIHSFRLINQIKLNFLLYLMKYTGACYWVCGAHATQLLSKKCCRGGKLSSTNAVFDLTNPAPETSALPPDQLADAYKSWFIVIIDKCLIDLFIFILLLRESESGAVFRTNLHQFKGISPFSKFSVCLLTEFAAFSKPSTSNNLHRTSYPKTQQPDQVAEINVLLRICTMVNGKMMRRLNRAIKIDFWSFC